MQTSEVITAEPVSKEYIVRRLNADNLADLARLHAVVYNVPADLSFFYKKYDTSYTGLEYVGLIAYNIEEEPVAYYGVIPCFIEYQGKLILAAQSADTMTHPRFRYKGMFVELSRLVFGLCRQCGIRLVFGFPNQNSYHGAVNKLGWMKTHEMSCFRIPVRTFLFYRLLQRNKFLQNKIRGWVLKNYLTTQPGIGNAVVREEFAGLWRDETYLQYKTYHSSFVIRIDGVTIWIRKRNPALIGDFEGLTAGNFDKVIATLKKIAGGLGIKEMQFHCSPGTNLHRLFSERYMPLPSYPVLFQDFGSPVAPEKVKFSFADIDIF